MAYLQMLSLLNKLPLFVVDQEHTTSSSSSREPAATIDHRKEKIFMSGTLLL